MTKEKVPCLPNGVMNTVLPKAGINKKLHKNDSEVAL